jgi:hypothetical protein
MTVSEKQKSYAPSEALLKKVAKLAMGGQTATSSRTGSGPTRNIATSAWKRPAAAWSRRTSSG